MLSVCWLYVLLCECIMIARVCTVKIHIFEKPKDDKDKDAFIGPKEFVLHMMMTQIKDKLFQKLK